MTCGIYLGAPLNGSTDKVYIGQSIDIEGRVKRHLSSLQRDCHIKKIQDGYNAYGEFSWEILKICSEEELDYYEEYYIKLFNAFTNGFNTYENSNSAPILYGIDNGKVTEELVQLYQDILNTTILYPTYSRYKIAEMLGVPEYSISHIWYPIKNSWIVKYFSKEYDILDALRNNRRIGGATAKEQGIIYPILLNIRLEEHIVDNARSFANTYKLDTGDVNRLLNKKIPCVKGWIIKDLDVLAPDVHNKFYSCSYGMYRKQFDLYKKK